MRLKFSKEDSIYKIFKSFEKIPQKKKVEIIIHPENSFFDNLWLWKQVLDLLKSRKINYKFICKSFKTKDYFKSLWVECEFDRKILFYNYFLKLKNFIFSTKDFHSQILGKRNYLSFIIVSLEIFLVFFVLYFFYSVVTPNSNVYIKPSFSIEEIVYNFRYYPYPEHEKFQDRKHISVPYYTGVKEISHNMSINVEDLNYLEKPSHWEVKIYNESQKSYSIVANSKFVTKDWLLFRSKDWFKIPAVSDNWAPWVVNVKLEAMEKDTKWSIIWKRWDIKEWKKLFIKNLKNSFNLENIYAIAKEDFEWWETISKWTIQESDIEKLKSKLKRYLEENKSSFIEDDLEDGNKFLLKVQDNMNLKIRNYEIPNQLGQRKTVVKWKINAELEYKYLKWKDIKFAFEQYIKERDFQKFKIINIDKDSLIFYKDWIKYFDNYLAIPTKINVVRWYDFQKDLNQLKDTIKSKIVGKSSEEAKKIILSYPEIDVVIVNSSPPWYKDIPSLKSRY